MSSCKVILPDDFQITITSGPESARICVVHLPTGSERTFENAAPGQVGKVRDQLLRELRGELFQPEDVRVDTLHTSHGEVVRVVHLPSGISRMLRRCDGPKNLEETLLDEILEELHNGN